MSSDYNNPSDISNLYRKEKKFNVTTGNLGITIKWAADNLTKAMQLIVTKTTDESPFNKYDLLQGLNGIDLRAYYLEDTNNGIKRIEALFEQCKNDVRKVKVSRVMKKKKEEEVAAVPSDVEKKKKKVKKKKRVKTDSSVSSGTNNSIGGRSSLSTGKRKPATGGSRKPSARKPAAGGSRKPSAGGNNSNKDNQSLL